MFTLKTELKVFGAVALVSIILVNLLVIILNNNISFNMSKDNNSVGNYLVVSNEEAEEEQIVVESNETIEEESNDDIVYDNMTMDELAEKIEKSLNSTVSGKGYLIASYSLEMGVDPYLSTAIMLHETGCTWECSYLVKSCNNVGGQKGSGCGSYSYFDSLDEGIIAFINNLSKNYINYGLTTPETINSKYAEDPNWAINVNKYIEKIKAQ